MKKKEFKASLIAQLAARVEDILEEIEEVSQSGAPKEQVDNTIDILELQLAETRGDIDLAEKATTKKDLKVLAIKADERILDEINQGILYCTLTGDDSDLEQLYETREQVLSDIEAIQEW